MGKIDELSKEVESFRKRLQKGGVEWVGGSNNRGGNRAGKGGYVALASGFSQAVGGGAAFIAVLALSQAIQGAVLRVSCTTPLGIPSALGFATVAVASVASGRVADGVSGIMSSSRKISNSEDVWQLALKNSAAPLHGGEIGAGSFGLVLFRALGGRFNAVAPSALHMPGAFGRYSASLPATLEYASDAKRQALAALGKNFGCHSCGTRSPATYIADHMPPLKTVKLANAKLWRKALRQTVSQRFYPQCQSCSTLQSSAVRTGVTTLKYHASLEALRPYHFAGALLVLGKLFMVQDTWWRDR